MQKFFVTQEIQNEAGVGYYVDADVFTIEVSGALTFWRIVVPGELSELVLAVAPKHWLKVEKQS